MKYRIGDLGNQLRQFNIAVDIQKERIEVREEIIKELIKDHFP